MFRVPPPYLWTPLSPQRVKGCTPLTIPKKKSKPKNASRFAKRIFLCFSHLRLRRRFYLPAELHALRGRNTRCEAANRRNEKKALSAATSFFPFRQPLRDYQGRAALDNPEGVVKGEQPLIRASRASKVAGAFLVLFWRAKENFSLSSPPAQYSAVPHPTATRRECVPPAPSFSGGCGPASRGLPMSGR